MVRTTFSKLTSDIEVHTEGINESFSARACPFLYLLIVDSVNVIFSMPYGIPTLRVSSRVPSLNITATIEGSSNFRLCLLKNKPTEGKRTKQKHCKVL